MDAHLFRRLAPILERTLTGTRVERIFSPLPDIVTLAVFGKNHTRWLVLRRHRSEPLLYLTDTNPLPNPAFPPALTMRLRKHAENRRLDSASTDWVGRRMAFSLSGKGEECGGYLMLDLRRGAHYAAALPPDFPLPAQWPPPDSDALKVQALHDTSPNAPWRAFSTLTPALRRTLALLDHPEKTALLVDLETGLGDLFPYGPSGGAPALLSPWPLPHRLLAAELVLLPAPHDDASVLDLLLAVSAPRLAALAEQGPRKEHDSAVRNAAARRDRLLSALLREEERLREMLTVKEDALCIQSQLWRFPQDAKLECLENTEASGESRRISLDGSLTLRENMAAMFRRSDKAARGLAALAPRIAALKAESAPALPGQQRTPDTPRCPAESKSGGRNILAKATQTFISSDGFLLLRGRNAEGNRELLKQARPFDLWFHTQDGPSAHLILKRDHGSHEVPEQTLLQAAALVALKSRQRHDAKVRILCALAKHVHPVRGGAPGLVRVDKVWRSFLAPVDGDLEALLARR